MKKEYGIVEFLETFTDEYCKDYLMNFIFPDGNPCCIFCGNVKVYNLGASSNYRFRCAYRDCDKRFNYLSTTIFSNTKCSLRTWFFIIYQISSNKKNKSSIQAGKDLSISQKTAWRLKCIVRNVLKQDLLKLKGVVEIDEAFISKTKNKYQNNWGAFSTRKAPIIGMMERGGKVFVQKIHNRSEKTLTNIITKHIEKGSTVYTDAWNGYKNLNKIGYDHDYINHSAREYVRGKVHTNSIEGFWSFLKRNIRSAHHQVSDKHLQSYIDEAVFKFNNRHLTQMERFNIILEKCIKI